MANTPTDLDSSFMRRAIDLAMRGRGRVEPNPMVGCVIVKDGRIIGEGFHEQFGGPHAEPNALAACTQSPRGATAYVTIEPCCHIKKKTPPCVPRLIEAGLARIVIGTTDPNIGVNGQGIAQLRAAGIDVTCGVLERSCQQLIAPFLANWRHNRPYVTLKWAQTRDGKVAGPPSPAGPPCQRLQISNALSSRAVHGLRSRCDAILVGINTVLADDPLLTPRNVPFRQPLLRIVLDRSLRIPVESKLVQTATTSIEPPPIGASMTRSDHVSIFCSPDALMREAHKARALEQLGAHIHPLDLNPDGTLSLSHLLFDHLRHLHAHLLVEPGPTLARSFLETGLVDRLWVIQSPTEINSPTAPSAPQIPSHYIPTAAITLAGDTLTEYLNPHSPIFFSPDPSADIVAVGK